jgi:membrane complex biogenesis BtpA family protein
MKKPFGPIIGMLHIPALPGSPRNELALRSIIAWVLNDAGILADSGAAALMLENFGDVPFYPRRVPAHTVALMTAIAVEVKRACQLPLGINVLRNDAESALAVAAAVGAEFIRVNIHTGARLTDQGLIEGVAHETLRYRKLLGSEIAIFSDIQVKHSAALAERSLEEEVDEAVSRGCADAVIVTGTATGKETAVEAVKRVKRATSAPVYAGSGIDERNVAAMLAAADGVIVGTSLKIDGVSANPIDPQRVRAFMRAATGRQ